MNNQELRFEYGLQPGDDRVIRRITSDTGAFYDHEVQIAEELAQEHLLNGASTSGYHFVACYMQNQIVGYTCYGEIPCTRNRYDLYWIVVDPKYSRREIGSQLIHLTENQILRQKGEKIYIETSSREPYLAARKFYIKHGYREVAIFKDYYDNGDHKIVYEKHLTTI